MQNILLLTDFSRNANNAIDYAMQLFSKEICHFYLLNVQRVSKYISSDLITSPYNTIHDAVIKNPKKTIDSLVNELREKYSDEHFSFEGICDYDGFISSVKQVVAIKKIELIIMGTNGMSGIKESVFGSNTIQVVKKIDVPTLVVPENYIYQPPDTILFIDETDEVMKADTLKPLKYFILKYKAQLHMSTDDKESNTIKEFLNDITINFIPITNLIADAMMNQAVLNHNIQMVSKVIKPKSFFKRIFSKSQTANFAYASKVPLLFL